jgi:SAM-dependent methyltransferase
LPPDRRVLEQQILPYYARARGREKVLFVGVKAYNRHLHAAFAGRAYVTIDPEPAFRRFGAKEHIVGLVEDLGQHFPPGHFDAIVMNGVIGHGLDDPAHVRRAMAACHAGLRPGGDLVLGVNEESPRFVDFRPMDTFAPFVPFDFPPLGRSYLKVAIPFVERSHSFFFVRRP